MMGSRSGDTSDLRETFERERGRIWGIAYRMTGSAADADDLVQDTFERALARPPADRERALGPWLVTVMMNLARDALRRRRRTAYTGPWLPSPVEDERELAWAQDPAQRLALQESVSFAYLLALEALTPQQRAVLVLREVLDYSVADTAAALAMSASNVKVVLHRARHALARARAGSLPFDASRNDAAASALAAFVGALVAGDGPALERMLAADVRVLSDGGGTYVAATHPVLGRERVMKFFQGLVRLGRGRHAAHAWRQLNGERSLILEFATPAERQAPRAVWRCELDAAGRIRELHLILAPRKLVRISTVG